MTAPAEGPATEPWEYHPSMSPAAEDPATVTLTGDERNSLRCDCWQMDGVWQHKRHCRVPDVERIVAARVDALTADLADRTGSLEMALGSARFRQGRIEELERVIANVRALADEWWGRATEARTPPTWREVCRDLRAAVGAAPTEEGTDG